MKTSTHSLIEHYYDYFNQGDIPSFLNLLNEDVIHDINQGEREIGRQAFATFMDRMDTAYQERIEDLTIMTTSDGNRAAAEFTVIGIYKKTDQHLPTAKNQSYSLRCGAFFEIKDGKISRVTNYYNLNDWLKQIKE